MLACSSSSFHAPIASMYVSGLQQQSTYTTTCSWTSHFTEVTFPSAPFDDFRRTRVLSTRSSPLLRTSIHTGSATAAALALSRPAVGGLSEDLLPWIGRLVYTPHPSDLGQKAKKPCRSAWTCRLGNGRTTVDFQTATTTIMMMGVTAGGGQM